MVAQKGLVDIRILLLCEALSPTFLAPPGPQGPRPPLLDDFWVTCPGGKIEVEDLLASPFFHDPLYILYTYRRDPRLGGEGGGDGG